MHEIHSISTVTLNRVDAANETEINHRQMKNQKHSTHEKEPFVFSLTSQRVALQARRDENMHP
jgi:hypothetical protein